MFDFKVSRQNETTKAVCKDSGTICIFEALSFWSEVSTYNKDSDGLVHSRALCVTHGTQSELDDSFYWR